MTRRAPGQPAPRQPAQGQPPAAAIRPFGGTDGFRPGLQTGDWPWLAAVLALGLAALIGFQLHAVGVTEGQGGAPLDDAWIHFQFARNLARGGGFTFNPGEPTAGSTAPLWTVLLAGVHALGGPFPAAGKCLSAAAYLFALGAAYALAKGLTGRRWAGGLAAAVSAVNGRFVWAGLSALETPLFAALSLVAVITYLRRRASQRYPLFTAALFGLATLTRPEGLLLFVLSLADHALHQWGLPGAASSPLRPSARRASSPVGGAHPVQSGSGGPARSRRSDTYPESASFPLIVLRLLPAAGLYLLLILPYVIFSLRTAGHPFPNTFSAKAVLRVVPDLDILSLGARYLILDNPLLLPFFLLGLGALLLSPDRVPAAWAAALPLAYAFMGVPLYQHGRYLIPLIPFNAAVSAVGLLEARRLASRRGWRLRELRGPLAAAAGVLVLAGTAWRLPTMGGLYAKDVQNINQMHVALGRWVEENTPPDALLALNDIGAITYISQRRIVDLAGLVSPEVVPILRSPDRTERLLTFMANRGVDYVIIFPNWFPGLAARGDILKPVHRVTPDQRTIAGGETMVVYRATWPTPPLFSRDR